MKNKKRKYNFVTFSIFFKLQMECDILWKVNCVGFVLPSSDDSNFSIPPCFCSNSKFFDFRKEYFRNMLQVITREVFDLHNNLCNVFVLWPTKHEVSTRIYLLCSIRMLWSFPILRSPPRMITQ